MSNVVGTYNKESKEHILHIRIATQMLLRRLVEKTDAYPLTESDITLIATASSLHDIGKVSISKDVFRAPDGRKQGRIFCADAGGKGVFRKIPPDGSSSAGGSRSSV